MLFQHCSGGARENKLEGDQANVLRPKVLIWWLRFRSQNLAAAFACCNTPQCSPLAGVGCGCVLFTTKLAIFGELVKVPSMYIFYFTAYDRLVQSLPTTLEVAPTTLQSCAYDPPIPLSGVFFDLQARATSEIAVADLSDSENNPLVRSSPTTLEVAPTTLQSCAYDPPIPLSEACLRPSNPHLRPSKVAPTTLLSPCQELTYDLQSRTYNPPKLRSPCQEVTITLFALWLLTKLTFNSSPFSFLVWSPPWSLLSTETRRASRSPLRERREAPLLEAPSRRRGWTSRFSRAASRRGASRRGLREKGGFSKRASRRGTSWRGLREGGLVISQSVG